MYQLWEALFCPVHGILRPANWVFIGPALAGLGTQARALVYYVVNSAAVKHFEHLRRTGVI